MLNWNEINEKLENLQFTRTLSRNPKEFEVFIKYTNEVYENFSIWEELHKKLVILIEKEEITISKQEAVLLPLVNIFYLTEGVLSYYIDIVIFTMMSKAQCFALRDRGKKREISRLDDLKQPRLVDKLRFLESHGFAFFSDICDRNLRNAIAHQDFKVDREGVVRIKKGKKKEYTFIDLIKMDENCKSVMNIVNRLLFA